MCLQITMNDWKEGHDFIMSETPNFKLSVKRLENKNVSKKFNVDFFKFKVKLDSITTKKDLSLNDDNIDYVREALMQIFKKVKSSFQKKNGPAYIQLNLSFDGLKKTFLKSGITPLFDKHSSNIVYWLINQLDQVEQSSENLVFSNNFFCDFIVIKTKQPKGKFNVSLTSKCNSKTSKTNYLLTKHLQLNIFFIDLMKQGFIDMKLFFNELYIDDTANCQLLSIYFGLLYQENNCNIKETITYIQNNFDNTIDFENNFINRYGLFSVNYLLTKTISYFLSHISEKIKKDILVFKQQSPTNKYIMYSTKNYPKKLPIKLFLNQNHISFICDNTNLEKKRSIFCDFCRKSFTNIQTHRCDRKKCINCNLYLEKINENVVENLCHSIQLKNNCVQCIFCKKIIENTDCYLRHKSMSKTMCSKVVYCPKCNSHYSHSQIHICGEKFCKKCFSVHSKQLFCSIKKKKLKISTSCVFICEINFHNGTPYTIVISEIKSNDCLSMYTFIQDQKYYSKILFSKETNTIVEEIKFEYLCDMTIENIIQAIELINYCPIFLMESNSFKQLIETVDMSLFTIYSNSKQIYKISSKYYSIAVIESYIDFDKVSMAKQLDIHICPIYLIYPKLFNTIEMTNIPSYITIDDFLHDYKHSDLKMFDYILNNKKEVNNIKTKTKLDFCVKYAMFSIIVYLKAFCVHELFLKDLLHKMHLNIGTNINNFNSILDFNSFSSCIFSIFLSALENQKLPTLPSCVPGTIMNTSKYEISFCKILNEYHKNQYTNHTIHSYINNNGRQYQKGNYTADWYCKECKVAIFIEGNFKYVCNKHEHSVKHVFKNKRRFILAKNGEKKRMDFMIKTKEDIEKMYVIGQCCILKNQYSNSFKNSIFYYDEFGTDVLDELKRYSKSEYTRMNYQKAILPAFTVSFKNKFESNGISKATKFDIDSAYLSVLTHNQFKLPASNIPDINLVNTDADIYFHKLDLKDTNFGFVKAFVINNNKDILPFIPIRSVDNGNTYSHCAKCSHSKNCNHLNEERGFYTEAYLSDLLYMKKLGYTIRVTQLIYFKSIHNKELHCLADFLMSYRKSDCNLTKKIAKKAALIGLGRFALNIGKNGLKNLKVIDNNQELCLSLEKGDIENIDFFQNHAICHTKNKISNYENAKLSTKLNCSSLLFGTVSNYVRREIFDAYQFIKDNNSHIDILRIDTDSLMIEFNNNQNHKLFQLFSNKSPFNYKIEMDNISLLYNYGKQSHFYKSDNEHILKVTGLRLSVFDRHYLKCE